MKHDGKKAKQMGECEMAGKVQENFDTEMFSAGWWCLCRSSVRARPWYPLEEN
jgi:hypothetical protein